MATPIITKRDVENGAFKPSEEAFNQAFQSAYANQFAQNRQKAMQDAALAQLIKGKQLDEQNAMNQFQAAQGAVNAHPGQHITARIGNASYGESMVDPFMRQHQISSKETKALKDLADKTIGSLQGQGESLAILRNAIENPSSVNDQQLQSGLARLSEGQGQRLLETIIRNAGISPTGGGEVTDIQNWIRGGGMSKMQPGQLQAIRDTIQQHANLLNQQFQDRASIYNKQAPLLAPDLGSDTIKTMYGSYAEPFQGSMARLTAPYKTPGMADAAVHNQATNQNPGSPGILDKLASFLKPGTPSASPAPSMGMSGQGNTPPTFEQWKAMKAQQQGQ